MQKLSLQQKLLQKLSPQQIQVIKLLELPALQLEQRIKKELEENPVLDIDGDDYEPSDDDGYTDDLKSNEDRDNEEFSVEDYLNDEDYYSGNQLEQHELQGSNGTVTVKETTNGDYYYCDADGVGYTDNGDGTWTDENGNIYTE